MNSQQIAQAWPPSAPPSLRWRRWRPRYRWRHGPLPLLALLNVILLLLLFMLWGSRFILQPGMLVHLPVAAFVSGASYGPLVVTITREEQVFFNDDRVSWERLGALLSHAVQKTRPASLTIEADARVPYETIVRVMNSATAAGLPQINLAIRPSFGEEIMP
ncbi:MAG: hypothetical protein GX806_02045 [Lentisphaerae bacterium]|nr:hypothetical protein [Lentisphaerota bacterium]